MRRIDFDSAYILAAIAAGFVGAALVACHVKPLPVQHPEYWSPEYGATDYPAMTARDGGKD